MAAPADGITLVAAEEITFPLSLDPAPEGLTPTFSRSGGTAYYGDQPLVFSADYSSGGADRVLVRLFPEDPGGWRDSGWSVDGEVTGTAAVDGTEAEVRRGDGYLTLLWERPDGRWVQVLGEGTYGQTAAAASVAGSGAGQPVRRPRLRRDDRRPVREEGAGRPGRAGNHQGLPARVALADDAESDPDTWLVAGQLPDGPLFLLLAPPVLTREQVLEIAEQVTYRR